MISSVSTFLIGGLIAGASAHSLCGIGSMTNVAHQTMTFVLPTITATVTEKGGKETMHCSCSINKDSHRAFTIPILDDSMPYPGLLPVPKDIDVFEAYKKTFLSTKNEILAWWYEGLSAVIPDGLPETPGVKSQTLQAFRVQQLSPTKVRADWHELILLGDFLSGEDLSFVHNAQSGINNTKAPNYYYDGPLTYYISKGKNNTIELEIKQPNTTVHKSTIKAVTYNNQIQFYQTEVKQRTNAATPFTSTLRFIASLDDVRNPNITTAKAAGYYHFTTTGPLAALFAYPPGTNGTTHTIGNTQKQGKTNEGYFPRQWASMTQHFPEWFNKAGEIAPDWTKVLTAAGLDP